MLFACRDQTPKGLQIQKVVTDLVDLAAPLPTGLGAVAGTVVGDGGWAVVTSGTCCVGRFLRIHLLI